MVLQPVRAVDAAPVPVRSPSASRGSCRPRSPRSGSGRELCCSRTPSTRPSVEAGLHDLAVFGWIGDTGDPDNFLYVLFHSYNAVAPSAQNIAFYRNPEVDALLIEAQGTSDEATRAGLYATRRRTRSPPTRRGCRSRTPSSSSRRAPSSTASILSPLGHPVYALIRRTGAR